MKTKDYTILGNIVATINEATPHDATLYEEDDKTILKVVVNGITVRANLNNINDYDLSVDDTFDYVSERMNYMFDNIVDILVDKVYTTTT